MRIGALSSGKGLKFDRETVWGAGPDLPFFFLITTLFFLLRGRLLNYYRRRLDPLSKILPLGEKKDLASKTRYLVHYCESKVLPPDSDREPEAYLYSFLNPNRRPPAEHPTRLPSPSRPIGGWGPKNYFDKRTRRYHRILTSDPLSSMHCKSYHYLIDRIIL